jgi:hypothetical protein
MILPLCTTPESTAYTEERQCVCSLEKSAGSKRFEGKLSEETHAETPIHRPSLPVLLSDELLPIRCTNDPPTNGSVEFRIAELFSYSRIQRGELFLSPPEPTASILHVHGLRLDVSPGRLSLYIHWEKCDSGRRTVLEFFCSQLKCVDSTCIGTVYFRLPKDVNVPRFAYFGTCPHPPLVVATFAIVIGLRVDILP